jgi:hypothetical protein
MVQAVLTIALKYSLKLWQEAMAAGRVELPQARRSEAAM